MGHMSFLILISRFFDNSFIHDYTVLYSIKSITLWIIFGPLLRCLEWKKSTGNWRANAEPFLSANPRETFLWKESRRGHCTTVPNTHRAASVLCKLSLQMLNTSAFTSESSAATVLTGVFLLQKAWKNNKLYVIMLHLHL